MDSTRGLAADPDLGQALLADDPAVRALGASVAVTRLGAATARMPTSTHHGNGRGIVHGGYVFAIADTAFAYAMNSHGRTGVSVHADIAFLRPARAGAELTASAAERSFDGRAGIYDVEVRDDAGQLLAEIRIHGRVPTGSSPRQEEER
ncbi:MAG TPA: hotdog fold thioesterase [Baekduia sp.]